MTWLSVIVKKITTALKSSEVSNILLLEGIKPGLH